MTALVLLCLVTAASARVSADDAVPDAATLRARMADAIGPDNDNYRETIIESTANGDVLITDAKRGANTRETRGEGPFRTTSGTFNGLVWNQDENGVTYADTPDPGAAARAKVTTTVQRVSSPMDAYVLSVIDEDGFGYRLYVDPVTYLVQRRDYLNTDGSSAQTYGPYKRYGTQLMATTWTSEDLVDKSTTTYTRTSFSTGVATDADVAVPPVRQLVTFPPGVANVDLNATFSKDTSLITLPVMIGSRRIYFILDSGSSGFLLDQNVAASLGLTQIGSGVTIGANRVTTGEVVIPSMDINGVHVNNVAANTLVFGTGRTPDDPAGLIGFDFFAELIVNVDNANHRVVVSDPRTFAPPAGRNVDAIPIRLGNRVPAISMDIGGAIAERMVVDTGSDDGLYLFGYFARRHGNVFRDRPIGDVLQSIDPGPDYGFSEGLGGEAAHHITSVKYYHLGHYNIREASVDVIEGRHGFPWNFDGLLGRAILRAFDLVFDYEDGLIYIWPTATGP